MIDEGRDRASESPVQRPATRSQQAHDGIERVGAVGCGLIGSRMIALFMSNGLDVTVFVRSIAAEERVRRSLDRCLPALARLGRPKAADSSSTSGESGLGRVTFVTRVEDAVADADFIQESTPDDDAVKLELLSRIDAASRPAAIIASSTSGILPSFLQSACTHPERMLVGHPFNPAHIVPLVEVVPGKLTDRSVTDRTLAFYSRLGKEPLLVRKEAPGFVGNRIQEAVWREMFHLVNDDIATTGELDAAVTNGPGLRWALIGPAFVYLMQGGSGGMAWALEQFDPARIPDWSHNYYPPITDALKRSLDDQTKAQTGGRSLEEWEQLRDEFLIRILEIKRELLAG